MMSKASCERGSVTYRYGSSANDADALAERLSDDECENVGRNMMFVMVSGVHSTLACAFQLSLLL